MAQSWSAEVTDRVQPGWEPDPRKLGNWREMFDQQRGGRQAAPSLPAPALDDADPDTLASGQAGYRPWIVQRGRTRPVMMLHLRRFDPRSSMWIGWALAYPTLNALEYTGPGMLSLDFGKRQFVIEGGALETLVEPLQLGMVIALQEYSSTIWPAAPAGALVRSIRPINPPARNG